jgi:hypothetical protein
LAGHTKVESVANFVSIPKGADKFQHSTIFNLHESGFMYLLALFAKNPFEDSDSNFEKEFQIKD